MTGGLYRSAHAARDGDDYPPGEAVLIATDDPPPGAAAAAPGALPPEPVDTDTASSSAGMAIGSLVSRLTGFGRTVMLGATLGAAGVGNAFTTSLMLPSQIYELLLGGILSSVLVPLLVRRRRSEPDRGEAYTRALLTVAGVALAVVAALAVLAAPVFTAIQASTLPADYRHLTTVFSYLILPMIFFTGLSALLSSVLNVRGSFAAPVWAPIANNLVVVAACGVFIGLFGVDDNLSPADMTPGHIALITGGTLLGVAVQAATLIPALRKVGFRWRWRWAPRSLGLRELAGLGGWMLCYVGANQVSVFLVVKLLQSDGENAGVMIFNNIFLLVMMAHGIITVSIMTVLLPRMSAAAADGRTPDLVADLSRGLRTVTAALAPVVVGYAVLAAPISVVLFQHGRYTAEATSATAQVLLIGAFAVLPLSISYLCTFTFYSLQGNRTAALINLPVVGVRIGTQLLLADILPKALTAAGLTAGNAISYVTSAAISLIVLHKRLGRLGIRVIAATAGKVAGAAAVAAAAGWLVVSLLPGSGLPTFWQAVMQLIVGGMVIVGGYVGLALLLRVHEVSQVIGMVRRKLGR